VADEFARKPNHFAQFNEESLNYSASSSSFGNAGSDSKRFEEPDDDDNGHEELLPLSAHSTWAFRVLGVPKPKHLVNGNLLKSSAQLEPNKKKKKKDSTANVIRKTDTSESPVSVGLDLSQKIGGILLNGGIVNDDSETTDRKERIRSSK